MTARDPRPAAELVADALDQVAGTTTVGELAQRTGLGTSTVGKALTGLETAGQARRRPGGQSAGRRQPDQWSPVRAARAARTPNRGPAGSRLGSGDLRALVLEALRDSTGPLGASAIGRQLGRSVGAVSNACERLVVLGEAARVSDSPRRYEAAR